MKTFILFTTMLMFCGFLKGQDIKSDSTKFTYCELVGTQKLLTNKIVVSIDFGESKKLFSLNRYKDPATGKAYEFNSMIDALNFMGKDNWEFVQTYIQTYTIGTGQSGSIFHFLLKKQTSLIEKEK